MKQINKFLINLMEGLKLQNLIYFFDVLNIDFKYLISLVRDLLILDDNPVILVCLN